MKDFTTAAKRKAREEKGQPRDTFTFRVDDDEITSVRPSEGMMVMLMTAQGSEVRDDTERIAGLIDSAMSLFDRDSRRILSKRLLDPEDEEFTLDFLMEVVQEVVEEWADRPTKPSSDSTSQSEDDGTSSTENSSDKVLASSTST